MESRPELMSPCEGSWSLYHIDSSKTATSFPHTDNDGEWDRTGNKPPISRTTSNRSPNPYRDHVYDGSASRRSHRSISWWRSEVVALFLSIACIVVIVVVLARAEGKQPPSLPLDLTLNTVLAFFTTLSRVCFMLPIVEGLGQLKWLWYLSGKPRQLADFQLFDEATRGAFGSIKLLVRFKGFLSCVAAVVTLSGLFTSPLTQQAIEYVTNLAPSANGTASIDRATTFSLYNGSDLVLAPYDTTREKQAIVNGAFFVPNETVPDVAPSCSSGECSWDTYGSLALCSDVVNITESVNKSALHALRQNAFQRAGNLFNNTFNMVSDISYDNYMLQAVPASFPVIMGPVPNATGAFNESVSNLMVSDHYIAYADELLTNVTITLDKFKFLEFGLYWCTKSMVTTVEAGNPRTLEVGRAAVPLNTTPSPLNFSWSRLFYECYMAGTCNATLGGQEVSLAPPPGVDGHEMYTVDVWTSLIGSALVSASAYDALLLDTFRGVVASNGGGLGAAYGLTLFGDFMASSMPTPQQQLDGSKNVTENIARSLTNLIRSADTRYRFGNRTSEVQGTVYSPEQAVHIRWAWMSLLITQLGLATFFLIATIVTTYMQRVQVLKGSALAMLSGLDAGTRADLGGIDDMDRLKRRAGKLNVKLQTRRGSGVALWLAKDRADSTRPWWQLGMRSASGERLRDGREDVGIAL